MTTKIKLAIKLKEETPEMFIQVGKIGVIQIHWLKHKAGRRAVAIIFRDQQYLGIRVAKGCGHDKMETVLDSAFQALGKMPRGWNYSPCNVRYHKGGNYYYIPVKEVRCYAR